VRRDQPLDWGAQVVELGRREGGVSMEIEALSSLKAREEDTEA